MSSCKIYVSNMSAIDADDIKDLERFWTDKTPHEVWSNFPWYDIDSEHIKLYAHLYGVDIKACDGMDIFDHGDVLMSYAVELKNTNVLNVKQLLDDLCDGLITIWTFFNEYDFDRILDLSDRDERHLLLFTVLWYYRTTTLPDLAVFYKYLNSEEIEMMTINVVEFCDDLPIFNNFKDGYNLYLENIKKSLIHSDEYNFM